MSFAQGRGGEGFLAVGSLGRTGFLSDTRFARSDCVGDLQESLAKGGCASAD